MAYFVDVMPFPENTMSKNEVEMRTPKYERMVPRNDQKWTLSALPKESNKARKRSARPQYDNR